jgi:RHS repeat-associated protein
VDVLYSAGTSLQTFFSLGRYPSGDGQFGYAQWSGPASAQISNDPVQYCIPYNGLPVQFEDSSTKLADMNGDGLQDIVYSQQGNIVYWPGRGNGYFGTGDPVACPSGSFGQDTGVAMAQSPWYSDPNGSTLRFDDVNGDGLDDLVQVGLNYVEIWLNVDGTSWTQVHTISNSPPAPSYANRVRLVDVNGNGTRDVLWGDASAYKYIDLQGGVRPWVLTHVGNGLGKTTDIQYGTSTQLMLSDALAGKPWTSVTPMPIHVVTQVTDRDNLNLVGRAGGVYITQYAYRDAVYDGRQREFRGFRTATATHVGDVNSPTSTTTSTFLLGECKNDEGVSPDPCSEEGRWQDNPRESLKGLPLVSETYDGSGTYVSTSHHTYRLRKLYAGLDGREVRHAFESQADSYLYDTAPFTASAQVMTLTDVELEASLGSPQSDTAEQATLRAVSGRAHTHQSSTVDAFGNTTASTSDGCVDGCASIDESITATTTPGRPACDTSGWIYRTTESYVAGSQTPGQRSHAFTQYDCAGNPLVVTAILAGSLILDRFHENGAPTAGNIAPNASQNGPILVRANQYDALGQLQKQTGPNGHCHQVVYDASFDELPVQETVFVGEATGSCTGTPLSAIAYYDRGLGTVTQVTDLHGEVTTAAYDGFGRLTTQTKPDPQNVGQTSGAASVLISYCLPGDPAPCTIPAGAPYSTIYTQSQDGPDASTASYRAAFAYEDGFGRTLITLDQADPNAGDGGNWVVNGLTDYDAKGTAQRAYRAWFWSGAPTQFPLGIAPPSLYGRQRYDAFGRQLQTFNLDGSVSIQSAYHATSVDRWDAADLEPGPHQGTPASTLEDGHGRTVAVTERVHAPGGGGIESRETRTTYLATGEPSVVTRVRVGASDPPVVRWFLYDSLGRMILNVDPNTTNGFSADPSTAPGSLHAWRYAYNDNGDLVGTSDARGCGANYYYDAGGRILAEDFSPCTSAQYDYTAPELDPLGYPDGNGTEAFYLYDVVDADSASIPGFAIDASLVRGRLVAVSDRAAKSVTRYDGRGRSTGMARRMAPPGTPNGALASRYTPHWYVQIAQYDGADRPVLATTGADVPALLDSNGKSYVTTAYSKRGTVSRVGSGYGDLVTTVNHDADGPVNLIVYGDVAKTQSVFSYDTRRRLSSVQTYRGPPAIWSQQQSSSTSPTFQLLLQDLDYLYDAVDNPTEVRDFRNPAEWPSGTQPVTRKIQYDDLYRVTSVSYAYASGSDSWVSPFDAEDNRIDADPRRAQPSPHVRFDRRVLGQTFQYDWLGNTVATDDDAHGFYDRSLGAITNGTATRGPYQLQAAQSAGPSALSGALSAAYDDAGNLTSLQVTRDGPCLPAGASCTQLFKYEWDEVGRLAHAMRWDGSTDGAASAELAYAYDSSDRRTLKSALRAGPGRTDVHTVYALPALDLRRTTFDGTDFARVDAQNNPTEVAYLFAHGVRLARLHYALASEPTATSGRLHLLFDLPDHLGSTSVVIDRDTSEVVEASSYLATGSADSDYRPTRWNSFREDYGFTGKEEDIELGLQYFGERYFAPSLGRWLSTDPLAVHSLGADANLYAYVQGRVFRAVDPVGLDWRDWLPGGKNFQYDPGLGQLAGGMGREALKIMNEDAQKRAEAGRLVQKGDYSGAAKQFAADAGKPMLYTIGGAGTLITASEYGLAERSVAVPGQLSDAVTAPSNAEAGAKSLRPVATIMEGAFFVGGMAAGAAADVEPPLADALKTETPAPAGNDPVVDAPPKPASPPDANAQRTESAPACSSPPCGGSGTCFTAGTLVQTAHGAVPIEDLRVGDRVLADADEDPSIDTDVVSENWRVAAVQMPNPDGSDDVIDITLLRPVSWLYDAGFRQGALVGIQLPEYFLEGPATVVAVLPAPPITHEAGRVVLSTITHLSNDILSLHLAGVEDRLRVTPTHRVFSADRREWVDARALGVGEHLLGAEGPVEIDAIRNVAGVRRVYNLEVEEQHTFLVTPARVLVHNAGCPPTGPGGSTTEPTLPARNIATEGEVTVQHYYRGGDHPPAHAHVTGGGRTTRIGPNGKPLKGDPELTGTQKDAVEANKSAIRSALRKIGRWLEYKESNEKKGDNEEKENK